jgi:hypothetical protein
MRSASGPSLVPSFDVTAFLVLEDFGELGRAYVKTDEEKSDRETVVTNLLAGGYNKPVRVVAFNTAEGWSQDVSEEIAWEVLKRAPGRGVALPDATHYFVASQVGEETALFAENAL